MRMQVTRHIVLAETFQVEVSDDLSSHDDRVAAALDQIKPPLPFVAGQIAPISTEYVGTYGELTHGQCRDTYEVVTPAAA